MLHRTLLAVLLFCSITLAASPDDSLFDQARANAALATEGFSRCDRFVHAWLNIADPKSGLIPRNTSDLNWVSKDSAADNYPFMVLTTSFTDRALFDTRMLDMLRAEQKLTSRLDSIRDDFAFKTQSWTYPQQNLERMMFGTAEYIKDGLLPLTEWLGPSPWRDAMLTMLDDMWKHAFVETPYGKITSTNVEVQGDQLQSLSRIYWITGDRKYLDYAIRLGDYYLLGDRHPTRHLTSLRLRDHGCEIVSGLVELYAALHFADPQKKQQYQKPVHEMLDRILEVGRNEHGLFYDVINPVAGKPSTQSIGDNWGYTLNAHYTVHLLDNKPAYRDAVLKALSTLNDNYRNYHWEGGPRDSADGHADAIESALNLYNRERVESAAQWIDHDIQVLWSMQKDSGIIEGWHGDGNFARTTIMYCLWKTQGTSVRPWRPDVKLGAVQKDGTLYITLSADKEWTGALYLDTPRHKLNMKLPIDYPRINQFPEWFTIKPGQRCTLTNLTANKTTTLTFDQLIQGIPITLEGGAELRLIIK